MNSLEACEFQVQLYFLGELDFRKLSFKIRFTGASFGKKIKKHVSTFVEIQQLQQYDSNASLKCPHKCHLNWNVYNLKWFIIVVYN